MIDQHETTEFTEPKRKSVWPLLVMAVVLLAIGAGVLALLDQGGVDTGSVELSDTETGSVVTEPEPDPTVETPSFVPSDEPIADAADIILPSVVQIGTGDGLGSGVIYDPNGLILTAAHVVAGNETVTVRFADGEEIEGTVMGGDSDFDVAVIKVDRTGLPAAALALDTEPRAGQLAIAVGSPWGLQSTVTAGIISAVNQSISSAVGPRSVLQTDAAINPGNSGGALVNRQGEVLGINVSIFSVSGANDGVGFAVPIDVAYDIATAVLAGESLDFAFLGVNVSNVESGQAGALIAEITEGSGADVAGIEVGDLVTSIDGVEVQGARDLAAQVRTHRPGTTVELIVIRDGQELILFATLGKLPSASEQ